ncbi:class I SAM-dependent rRNA methyltransferase [Prosthecochloris sp. SCSIO W1101]|uniref:class I SAM-dependent rRNA methyltransferase n=1 Tax=Prosthecochloris sp. SCSIO W1101 TaxID=2992242 RepID=UPI00223CD5EB|nr:class I SAM-dependent rRNA methyltransferase [Prosthecochloris sp. SCSIO W1101]UZJ42654.1 class I SAM-dependent rRNA methyltransferase [Prosthecochloris sp. SCSIO W1101]
MDSLYLKPKEHRRLFKGHLWSFSNELQSLPKDITAGETVKLYTHDKKFVGTGFYNPHSLIAFRLLSRTGEIPNSDFFRKKILNALDLRKKLYPESDTNAFRLIHGESDGLPGLVVDCFNKAIAVQAFSAGMDRHLPLICDVLLDLFQPSSVIVRNESVLRELEGLPLYKKIVHGSSADAVQTIHDTGLQYLINLLEGHKTGFFLDQRDNRRIVRKIAHGAETLDVFTSDGGFGLNALFGGAKSATMVDISPDALQRAEENAILNKLSNYALIKGDAFDVLTQLVEEKKSYDLVILDPPSFTKSRKNLPSALHAYKKLNKLGLQLVRNGGFLATASCSHHVSEEDFLGVIRQSSFSQKKQLRQIFRNSQPADHPILLSMPETHYLKFACFYVNDM